MGDQHGNVDNDATVHIDGQQIGFTPTGFCIQGTINFSAADAELVDGTNLLAVRGHDFGSAAYLDQRVIYDVPVYSLCLLYDDETLGGSGGYIFNKSTKGLSSGTWRMQLSIDGDSQSGYQLLFDVRYAGRRTYRGWGRSGRPHPGRARRSARGRLHYVISGRPIEHGT